MHSPLRAVLFALVVSVLPPVFAAGAGRQALPPIFSAQANPNGRSPESLLGWSEPARPASRLLSERMRMQVAQRIATSPFPYSAAAGAPTGRTSGNDDPIRMEPMIIHEPRPQDVEIPTASTPVLQAITTGRLWQDVDRRVTRSIDAIGTQGGGGHGRIAIGMGFSW